MLPSASSRSICSIRRMASAERSRFGRSAVSGIRYSLVAASDDNIDVLPLLDDLVAAQLELAVGGAFAGLEVVFVAVPRAHEMGVLLGKGQAQRALLVVQQLVHLGDDQALAGRAALVQAEIAVG